MKLARASLALTIAAALVLPLSTAHADAGADVTIEISGPIFPNVLVLYQSEGANYPSTSQGELDLVHASALSFPYLLDACKSDYAKITVQQDANTPLSSAELATNYGEVGRCAYEKYTAKPYWIPKLIDDVDVCAEVLGAGWRLPIASDLAALTDPEAQHLADTLTGVASESNFWGTFYFSLQIFVRAGDGSIQKGDLGPGVSTRVTPLSVSGDALKNHYEGGVSLRCIRQS